MPATSHLQSHSWYCYTLSHHNRSVETKRQLVYADSECALCHVTMFTQATACWSRRSRCAARSQSPDYEEVYVDTQTGNSMVRSFYEVGEVVEDYKQEAI